MSILGKPYNKLLILVYELLRGECWASPEPASHDKPAHVFIRKWALLVLMQLWSICNVWFRKWTIWYASSGLVLPLLHPYGPALYHSSTSSVIILLKHWCLSRLRLSQGSIIPRLSIQYPESLTGSHYFLLSVESIVIVFSFIMLLVSFLAFYHLLVLLDIIIAFLKNQLYWYIFLYLFFIFN